MVKVVFHVFMKYPGHPGFRTVSSFFFSGMAGSPPLSLSRAQASSVLFALTREWILPVRQRTATAGTAICIPAGNSGQVSG
jgi:hypothetical protein